MVTEASDSGSGGAVTVSRCQMANSALLCFSGPAIVIQLTLMERGVSSLDTELCDGNGKMTTCLEECVEVQQVEKEGYVMVSPSCLTKCVFG